MSSAKLTLIGLYNYDPTLFDALSLPAGIDRYTLINNILLRSGDFEVMYGDANFIKNMVGVWSKKWQRTFQKWYDALQLTYDPISNYDRHETWDTTGESEVSGTSTNKVSAYNNNTLVDDNSNTSGSTAESATNRTGRAWGNIGITTSQQMLQSELDLASWNLYEHITDVFLHEFVIAVY